MLYDFHNLVKKYGIDLKGVLHVGAHECEELPLYEKYLTRDQIVWIDALPDKVVYAKNAFPGIQILEAAVADCEKEVTFHRANNGQSSSILELGTHAHHYPYIHYVGTMDMITKRIDTLLEENYPNFFFNFINLDIQGAELLALKGMESHLDHVDYIYTEVNLEPLYKDAVLFDNLKEYLSNWGFEVVDEAITQYRWGDALFIKKQK